MALNRVACPECKAGLKSASGFSLGQTVCCPKCETYFVVQESAATDGKKPVRADAMDDDEYDDDPKKKRRGGEEWSYKNSPARYAVLAVLVLVMCVLGYMLYEKRQRMAADNGGTPDDTAAVNGQPLVPPQVGGVGMPVGKKGGGAMMPPLPPPPPLPGKGGNPKINPVVPKQNPNTGVSPFGLLPGGSTPVGAEAEALTKKFKDQLIGTWKADIGNGFTVELVYKTDGTVTETPKPGNGAAPIVGKWSVTGLNGRNGLIVQRTAVGYNLKPERLVFEGDELEHPVVTLNVVGIFRKK